MTEEQAGNVVQVLGRIAAALEKLNENVTRMTLALAHTPDPAQRILERTFAAVLVNAGLGCDVPAAILKANELLQHLEDTRRVNDDA